MMPHVPGTANLLESVEIEIDACEADYALLPDLSLELFINQQIIFKVRFADLPCIRPGRPRAWTQPVNVRLDGDPVLHVGITPRLLEGGTSEAVSIEPFFHISGVRHPGGRSTIPAGQRTAVRSHGRDIWL